MRVTLSNETVAYLTGWHDNIGRNVGHSEVIDEIISWAISADIEKVLDESVLAGE